MLETIIVSRREKTCTCLFFFFFFWGGGGGVRTTKPGADQPAHPRRLISACVIRLLESIISGLATSEIFIF